MTTKHSLNFLGRHFPSPFFKWTIYPVDSWRKSVNLAPSTIRTYLIRVATNTANLFVSTSSCLIHNQPLRAPRILTCHRCNVHLRFPSAVTSQELCATDVGRTQPLSWPPPQASFGDIPKSLDVATAGSFLWDGDHFTQIPICGMDSSSCRLELAAKVVDHTFQGGCGVLPYACASLPGSATGSAT